MPAGSVLRPPIAAAWERAHTAGLRPDSRLDPQRGLGVETDSRLLVAARPVLDQLAGELADTRFALVLADRQARVVDHRVGPNRLADRLGEVGLVTGTVWDERRTGTNAVASVFEIQRGLSVVGDEHYLEDLKQFCCYGEPLFDPTTGRLEGVIDITGPVADCTPLLGPFLARARHEIERRLLDTSRHAHQLLLRAYEVAATGATRPVLAIGPDMLLANQAATEQLGREDIAMLRALLGSGGLTSLRLGSGVSVRVDCDTVAPGATLVRLSPHPFQVAGRQVAGPHVAGRRSTVHRPVAGVLVYGESGTGRTTTALERAGAGALRFDASGSAAADFAAGGSAAAGGWAAAVRVALAAGRDVVLDDIQLLDPATVARLRSALTQARSPSGQVVATSTPPAGLDGDHAALAALFGEHVPLPALAQDRARIPRLMTTMLAELVGADAPAVTPALAHHLTGLPWPGNLHELRSVVATLAALGGAQLDVGDLPERYRQAAGPPAALTPLERSEYETIRLALRAARGNKAQAARQLGIARGTLYSRMRRFKIAA